MRAVNYLDVPRFREPGVYRFIKDELRVPVTPTLIHNAIKAKQLKAIKLSGNNHFSTREILKWIEHIGIPVDWKMAEAECKRALALDDLAETDAALAQLG